MSAQDVWATFDLFPFIASIRKAPGDPTQPSHGHSASLMETEDAVPPSATDVAPVAPETTGQEAADESSTAAEAEAVNPLMVSSGSGPETRLSSEMRQALQGWHQGMHSW